MHPRIHAVVLRYLDEVAASGSIRSASAKLNVASSAISRQILKVEDALGAAIFERHPTGLRLTPAGDILLRHARSTLRDFDRIRSEIDALKGIKSGLVKIVSLDSLLVRFLPDAIRAFHAAHPAVTFDVEGRGPGDIAAKVASGDADLGFSFDLESHAGVELLAEVPTPLNAMMAPNHPLAERPAVSLADCAAYPLLFQQDTRPIQSLMDTELRAAREVREPFLRSNSLALTKEMIRHGLGVAFYTRLGFAEELAHGEIIGVPLIEKRLADLKLGMIFNKLRRPTVAVSAAIDHFRTYLTDRKLLTA
jgi:DNA-binding transcriptional LysR family regulator